MLAAQLAARLAAQLAAHPAAQLVAQLAIPSEQHFFREGRLVQSC